MPFINNTWQPRRFPNNGPPIKVLKYREKHNISPDVKLSDDDDRKAYVGDIEFLLPDKTTNRYRSTDKYFSHQINRWRLKYYPNKTFAIKELLRTKKGSPERRALINYMTDQELVPCKKTWLYELLMEVEEGHSGLSGLKSEFQVGEEWGTGRYTWRKWRRKDKLEVKVNSLGSIKTCEVGGIQFDMPLNGTVYTKREALKCIAKTKKGSVERGAMIRFMIREGYVSCKEQALYSLIRRVEVDRLPIGSDAWGKQSPTTYEDTHHDDDKIFGKLKRTWLDLPMDIEGSKWYNSDRRMATGTRKYDE